MSFVPVFDTQSVKILLFLLSIFHLMIFILIFINLLPFEKANKVVCNFMCYAHLSSVFHSFISSLDSHSILKFLLVALSDAGWRFAMQGKMTTLEQNDTWDLICLLLEEKTVSCHWVYTVKLYPDGSLTCLKACLVAKAYSQIYGIHYHELN